ncbi:hypothetical protein OKJ48_08070 [Streptomyces kunmingensis]|uniref:Uncharacterized protein n=1 Tax=Streptomyces kunmingensis TaxID=68225 RepID=A0ABU6C674_9ACTN|nr:hypothetical protein [Streptomyces kunmingensis]MEB3960205.1 hypothetical protein [Streptomyces kunmingensis]
MLIVALALLPVMGLLLICMDRIEDHLTGAARPPAGRHRVRHLRLVAGHGRSERRGKPVSERHHGEAA